MATTAFPPALPPHAVTLLLSHLSQLDDPLPPHLLSTPLRQRHHYLGLGHDLDTARGAATYLSWSSASGSEADSLNIVNLLNYLPSAENFDPLAAYPTKYSYDGEAVFAHAHVPITSVESNDCAGLRLVFRWEAEDGEGVVQGREGAATNADNWKYHDAKPMPFPPNTHDSPQEALHEQLKSSVLASTSTTQTSQSPALRLPQSSEPTLTRAAGHSDSDDDDNDAYWNSYGRSNSDDDAEEGAFGVPRISANKEIDDERAEEAYWAQYASVHGTADSTRHSPLPQKHKLHDPNQPIAVRGTADYLSYFDNTGSSHELLAPDVRRPTSDDPYSYSTEHEHIDFLRRFSPNRAESPEKGTPSPIDLERRLFNISPRPGLSPSPSPAPHETEEDAEDSEPIKVDHMQLEEFSSPDLISPETSDGHTLTPPGGTVDAIPKMTLSATEKAREGVDTGLHEAIRGSRVDKMDSSEQKSKFIDIVREALNGI
ncbi:uncharacterized protein FOMMEDRAFT_27757 [Fomitiporia mediterranea MF3/22]|uniref:uncharacterized protein n=1 Tax=Fomitiporia mediterranea (strain MF3/22) TaxID=694068 RepID=UPI000440982E|nr:uncharacterized protein FOMMEDRAFT_27757 [Fomitiporia mediterranea MF3/22]EJD03917.1 hypothetical protein FOMMEDRAFT_27757 [Fomitiporia mediterranea MF3/22]